MYVLLDYHEESLLDVNFIIKVLRIFKPKRDMKNDSAKNNYGLCYLNVSKDFAQPRNRILNIVI